ncbi:MAG TPA: hypothetical protein VIU42_11020 [Xanthobacteraceae bacterium]|jgi:hypothetical protein
MNDSAGIRATKWRSDRISVARLVPEMSLAADIPERSRPDGTCFGMTRKLIALAAALAIAAPNVASGKPKRRESRRLRRGFFRCGIGRDCHWANSS